MKNIVVVIATLSIVAVLLVPETASAQPAGSVVVTTQRTGAVPINLGLVPWADVNSHFVMPENRLSLDLVVGLAWRIEGAAVAGVAGVVRDRVRGAQLAGVAGYVHGEVSGAQLNGLVSATRGGVTGLQASGGVSYAGQIRGAQLGLINVAGKVRGLQLGLINVAEEVDGAVLGLINVVRKNGRHDLDLWTSNTAAFSLGTKLGTRHVYTVLGFGLQRVKQQSAWMPTVGLGGSIPVLGRGFVNLDMLASMVNVGSEVDLHSILGQLRAAGGFRVSDKLALYAGPVLDIFRSSSGKRLSDISYTSTLATLNPRGVPVDLGLGFVVGLQAL